MNNVGVKSLAWIYEVAHPLINRLGNAFVLAQGKYWPQGEDAKIEVYLLWETKDDILCRMSTVEINPNIWRHLDLTLAELRIDFLLTLVLDEANLLIDKHLITSLDKSVEGAVLHLGPIQLNSSNRSAIIRRCVRGNFKDALEKVQKSHLGEALGDLLLKLPQKLITRE